jgi:hypothetical protein
MGTIKHGDLPEAAFRINAIQTEFEWALSHTRARISNNAFAAFLTTFIASEIKPAHLLTLIPDQVGPCKRVAMALGM